MTSGFLFAFAFGAFAQGSPPPATYVRSFTNDLPNEPLVTVTVTGAVNVACFTIEEILPGLATPTSVSGDGVYLPAKNVIRWGPYFNTVATNVSYRLAGLPGGYPVTGGAWMDGQWFFSPGITMVAVQPPAGFGGGGLPLPPPQVALPVFTPPGGGSVPVSVTISDATPGAVIYYTLDGSLPTTSSTLYTGPVPLASPGLLRAAAFSNSWTPSAALTAYYGPAAVPANAQLTRNVTGNLTVAPVVTLNVAAGNNSNCLAVTESLAPGLGAINISSGGNYIASNNVVLWGPFFGTNAQTLSYQAVGLPGIYPVRASWSVDGVSGMEKTGSNVVIAVSGVNGTIPVPPPQVALPVFTPPGGGSVPVSVTITDATPGAVIYYTLDGSLPTTSSTPYTGAVPLASASVLRAVAFTNGWTPSVAAVGEYVPPPTTNTVSVTNSVFGNATIQPVVSLAATPQGAVNCYAVVETLPFGLTPSGLSGDGIWDPIAGAIRWGPYLDNQPRVFSFNVGGASGTYPLSGQVSVNGYSMSAGATNVQINTSVIGSAPQIGTQPSNQVALAGQTVQFTVGASGSSPLIYQWYFNTNTPLFSASTVAALFLTNVAPQSAGLYSVLVTNAYGSVTSSVASLTIVTPLVTNIVNGANGSVTLSFVGLPNATTRIWATTNLALLSSWQPIFTNTTTLPNGAWQFIDTNTAGYPLRFYRFSTP